MIFTTALSNPIELSSVTLKRFKRSNEQFIKVQGEYNGSSVYNGADGVNLQLVFTTGDHNGLNLFRGSNLDGSINLHITVVDGDFNGLTNFEAGEGTLNAVFVKAGGRNLGSVDFTNAKRGSLNIFMVESSNPPSVMLIFCT